MKRIILIFVTTISVFALASPVSAGKYNPPNLYWSVEWGTLNEYGSTFTRWYASADPVIDLQTFSYFYWAFGGGGLVRQITPGGVTAKYAAFYSPYMATGFKIGIPGASHTFAGTDWYRGICFPGPKVEFNFTERTVIISNTTPGSLWIFNQNDPSDYQEIISGETFSHRMPGWHNGYLLQITPSTENINTCASVSWWLDDLE